MAADRPDPLAFLEEEIAGLERDGLLVRPRTLDVAPAIVFPTVERGSARVRTIVTADHTEADLDDALAAFGSVGASLGLAG